LLRSIYSAIHFISRRWVVIVRRQCPTRNPPRVQHALRPSKFFEDRDASIGHHFLQQHCGRGAHRRVGLVEKLGEVGPPTHRVQCRQDELVNLFNMPTPTGISAMTSLQSRPNRHPLAKAMRSCATFVSSSAVGSTLRSAAYLSASAFNSALAASAYLTICWLALS
jgi:hypothetical protein